MSFYFCFYIQEIEKFGRFVECSEIIMPAVTRRMPHYNFRSQRGPVYARNKSNLLAPKRVKKKGISHGIFENQIRMCKSYNEIHYVTSWNPKYPLLKAGRAFFNNKTHEVKYVKPELNTPYEIPKNGDWEDGWMIDTIKNGEKISMWVKFEKYHQPLKSFWEIKTKQRKTKNHLHPFVY